MAPEQNQSKIKEVFHQVCYFIPNLDLSTTHLDLTFLVRLHEKREDLLASPESDRLPDGRRRKVNLQASILPHQHGGDNLTSLAAVHENIFLGHQIRPCRKSVMCYMKPKGRKVNNQHIMLFLATLQVLS